MAVRIPPLAVRRGHAAAELSLLAMGAIVLAIGLSQPAWVGGRVGPGLMMQGAGLGVVALAGLWLALGRGRVARGPTTRGTLLAGPLMLGAVLAFALLLPATGLVVAAMAAAALVGLGAGERSAPALVATALILGALTTAIGLTLLPPTAPLWPGR